MQKIIIFAILGYAVAAPALLLAHDADLLHVPLTSKSTITTSNQHHGSTLIHTPVVPVVHAAHLIHAAPLTSKTTVTKSSQVVNHGGITLTHSVPVVHEYHIPHYQEVYHVPQKATVTKSNQVVSHGSTHLIHAPVLPVVHSAPVLVHSSPLVTLKTGDSAVSHHSSTVHKTVPIVKSLPLVSIHH